MRALKTYPALGRVRMPSSATILAVHPRGDETQAPALLVSYDTADGDTFDRHFMVARSGEQLPHGARYLDSWRVRDFNGSILALFEVDDTPPPDLPESAVDHWRVLTGAGFELQPDKSWRAPPDMPAGAVTQTQIIAMVELQEHGFGGLVGA